MPKVLVMQWEESECGWGVRPDGWTMHFDKESLDLYCASFWAQQRAGHTGQFAPDVYTREAGKPFELEVDAEIYEKVKANKGTDKPVWGEGNVAPSQKGPWKQM